MVNGVIQDTTIGAPANSTFFISFEAFADGAAFKFSTQYLKKATTDIYY